MKFRQWKRRGGRITADLVEREQAVIAVERGIFERFGHQRPGELLHLQGKAPHPWRAVGRAAGLDQVHGESIAQEVEKTFVGGEPVGAGLLEGLRNQRAVMRGRAG